MAFSLEKAYEHSIKSLSDQVERKWPTLLCALLRQSMASKVLDTPIHSWTAQRSVYPLKSTKSLSPKVENLANKFVVPTRWPVSKTFGAGDITDAK